MRAQLRIPLGKLVNGERFRDEVKGLVDFVTVGDYCTSEALEASAEPKLAVIDMKVERRDDDRMRRHLSSGDTMVVAVPNPPTEITPEVWLALDEAYRRPGRSIIQVDGEEDLVTLPAIAMAPGRYRIAYGLPGEGVVLVEANDESKRRVESILERMEVLDGD